jgi:N-acetylneuraminate synthase
MAAEARVFIIAEAGVNHNGELDRAMRLVDVAAEAGADAVKFQTFRAEQLLNRSAPKAQYQQRATGSAETQYDMICKLELSDADHAALVERARQRGIEFMSTPFDEHSLKMLTGTHAMRVVKIASGEITNAPFLLQIARVASQVIMSTGMCYLAEIEAALGVLAFGFIAALDAEPNNEAFLRSYASDEGQAALRDRVRLLHCTTEYPAPFADLNLRAMNTLASAFNLPVGYSDHSVGLHASVAAVALGARVIEKHFTLDRSLPGPDHAASLEPRELADLVRQIRDVENALGTPLKRPGAAELCNRAVARKSLVATHSIRSGDPFTAANITCKRSGGGMSPFEYWSLLGGLATRDYQPDDPIDE